MGSNKITLTILAILLAAVMVLTAIQVAYAFTSETSNEGNNYSGQPTSILVLNNPKGSTIPMNLPIPTVKEDRQHEGPWHFNNYSTSVIGYLDIKFPEDNASQHNGKVRIWIDMKNMESWSVVQRITLTIYEVGDVDVYAEFTLFGADSELMEVGGEPIRRVLNVNASMKEGGMDWTGQYARKVVVGVEYREEVNVNPYEIKDLLVSTINFVAAAEDPIPSFTVKYHLGDTLLTPISVYQGNVLNSPSIPEGYSVDGWFLEVQSGQGTGRQWDFSSDHVDKERDGISDDGILNLYAQYSLKIYKITYVLNGGTIPSPDENPTTYDVGTPESTLTNPIQSGYTFDGWSGIDAKDSKDVKIGGGKTGDRTYTANWSYKITFYKNDESAEGEMNPMDMKKGWTKALTSNAFTKEGKVFYNWNTESKGTGTDHTDGEEVSDLGETPLYAQWGDPLSIEYDRNDSEIGVPSPHTDLAPGNTVIIKDKTTAEPSTFIGWTTDKDGNGDFYHVGDSLTIGNESLKLYAVVSDYIIHFDENGGTGHMSDQGVDTKVPVPLHNNSYTKSGYLFFSWKDSSDKYYQDGALITASKNLTLTAQWGHGIIYDANGADSGTVPTPTVVLTGDVVVKSQGELRKTGCFFAGWNTSADGTGVYYSEGYTFESIDADYTLFAIWACTVTYDPNEATAGDAYQSFIYGDTATILPAISRDGYTFKEWNTEDDGSGVSFIPGSGIFVTHNLKLYAIWSPNHGVLFNSNGGSGSIDDMSVAEGSEAVLTSNLYYVNDVPHHHMTNGSYTFCGWEDRTASKFYEDGAKIVMGDMDITLYAVWKYEVSFDLNGGPAGILAPESQYVTNGGHASDPEMELDGYMVSWYTTQRCDVQFDFNTKTITGKTTVYAKWEVKVFFISNNKTGTQDRYDWFPYSEGKSIDPSKIFNPTGGKTQVAWNSKSDGSGVYYDLDATLIQTYTMGLYAMWDDTYNITYYPNGTKGSPVVQDVTTNVKSQTSTNVKSGTTFERAGYTFNSWNTLPEDGVISGSSYEEGESITPTGNLNLYARWKCTVTFNANEGDGTVNPQDFVSGTKTTLTSSVYERAGHDFKCWNTMRDGSGISYQRGQTNVVVNEHMVLYAMWGCKVTFNANEGEGERMADQSFITGETKPLSENTYSKEGFVFYGWNTMSTGSGKFYNDCESFAMGNDDVVLYAIWGREVSFEPGDEGGGSEPSIICRDGGTVVLPYPNDMTKDSGSFLKWNLKNTEVYYQAGETINGIGSNMTMVAIWGCSVVFNPNNAISGVPPANVVTEKGSSVLAPDSGTLEKKGYDFCGWNVNAEGTGDNY